MHRPWHVGGGSRDLHTAGERPRRGFWTAHHAHMESVFVRVSSSPDPYFEYIVEGESSRRWRVSSNTCRIGIGKMAATVAQALFKCVTSVLVLCASARCVQGQSKMIVLSFCAWPHQLIPPNSPLTGSCSQADADDAVWALHLHSGSGQTHGPTHHLEHHTGMGMSNRQKKGFKCSPGLGANR